MDPLLVVSKINQYKDEIKLAIEKIAYYKKQGESLMKAREMAFWTQKLNDAKTAIQIIEAEVATAGVVTTAEAGTVASTGEVAAGHIIPRVLGGIGRAVSMGAAESASATIAVGAATVATVLIASGIVTWAAATAIGKMSADKPIEPVPAKSNQKAPNLSPFDSKPANSKDEYFIYSVNTSGLSLFIGRPSDVVGRKSSSVTDAGKSDDIVVFTKAVPQAFESRDRAIEYLKANVTPGKDSVWTGHWVKLGGQEYRTVHVGNLGK